MKYKYIGSAPSDYRGKTLRKGDEIESDIEMATCQFEKIEKEVTKVETPKKNITTRK